MDSPPSLTDSELVRRSRAGCLAAFDTLVHRHEARVYRYVCRRCGNVSEARDITQTAFIAAFRNLHRFNGRSTFASWLLAIARNRTIDCLRARRVSEELDPERLAAAGDPASTLQAGEDVDLLWTTAREVLTPGQFECLWLRYQEDLSVREVARVLRRTETGVKVTLFRARQALASRIIPNAKADRQGVGRKEPSTLSPTQAAFLRMQRRKLSTP